jgi:formate dehydrogenase beta subunit
MVLAQTEVYELATFYHHFDVVKEGQAAPAVLTVRVCDGLSCETAGAKELLAKLATILGREVRVIAAPCVGHCEAAPIAVVGQHPVPRASIDAVATKVAARETDVRDRSHSEVDLIDRRSSRDRERGKGSMALRKCSEALL